VGIAPNAQHLCPDEPEAPNFRIAFLTLQREPSFDRLSRATYVTWTDQVTSAF
jgi:hypothetical protein